MTPSCPMPRFNIIKKTTKKRINQRSILSQGASKCCEWCHWAVERKLRTWWFLCRVVWRVCRSLLYRIKLLGVNFDCTVDVLTTYWGIQPHRLLARLFLVSVWLNALLFITVFTASDHFGAILLMNIYLSFMYGQIALMHTNYYVASHNGQLLDVILSIPATRDCITIDEHRLVI